MNGLLPIYKKGTLKNFQLAGNFQNWSFDLIISTNNYILPFVTNFFTSILTSITSFQLKKVYSTKLSNCKTNADILAIVESSQNLNTAHVYKQSLSTYTKERYYGKGTDAHGLTLNAGIYYLYLSDGTNEFESELFKIC